MSKSQSDDGFPHPSVELNVLCPVCQELFRHISQHHSKSGSFPSLIEIQESASNGCHFCNVLLARIRYQGRWPPNKKTMTVGNKLSLIAASRPLRCRWESHYNSKLDSSIYFQLFWPDEEYESSTGAENVNYSLTYHYALRENPRIASVRRPRQAFWTMALTGRSFII